MPTGPAAPGARSRPARSPSTPSSAVSSTPPTCRRRSRCGSTYCYGFPAPIGGGPYDRSASLAQLDPAAADFFALVGSADYPTLESAVAAWNELAAGLLGIIVLPGFESLTIDLTGAAAVQLPAGSSLAIVAGAPDRRGARAT